MMLNQIDYYSGKTILVTGAAGFIGSSVVRALCEVVQILSLPIGPHLSEEQVNYVCKAVNAFFKK